MAIQLTVRPLRKDPIRAAALERSERLKFEQLVQKLIEKFNELRIK